MHCGISGLIKAKGMFRKGMYGMFRKYVWYVSKVL